MPLERAYYRKLLKTSRTYVVDLPAKQWCDLHHQHFDWDGKGNEGRLQRVRHLNAHLRALRRARLELQAQDKPFQLFAYIDLAASENDAVYIHTPNPNGTAFPAELGCREEDATPPPLLACRVDRTLFKILKSSEPGSQVFYLLPRE
jgi:hypothetical protein